MKFVFRRKAPEKPKHPERTFFGGPNWFSEPYMSFFDGEILNHLFNCEIDGCWPNSHQIIGGREVAVASTVGRVIVVSRDTIFLESLEYQLESYPYDIVNSPPSTPGGVGVLLFTARRLRHLSQSDGSWAEPALKALRAS